MVAVSALHIAIMAGAGVIAGMVNVLAGAGSLLTYPILVALGLSPLAANVTNDLGVVPGNFSGMVGVREDLRGQRALLWTLVPRSMAGSLIGAGLLLILPSHAFNWVAPPLLLLASGLTLAQPVLIRRARAAKLTSAGVFHRAIELNSVYGGYFGTGIGLIFIATLGIFVDETPARLNALKTVLQLISNAIAGVVFVFAAPVNWPLAAALATGTIVGGTLGARAVQYVSPSGLRTIVAVVGVAASAWLFARQLG
jgi:uncharacterized membrane protein YfcA